MYLHLSNITQSFILIFIFDQLFANLIGSKKHKRTKERKKENTKNIEIREARTWDYHRGIEVCRGGLFISNKQKKILKRLQFAKLWLLKNMCKL